MGDATWIAVAGLGATILTAVNALISTRTAQAQAKIAERKLNLDLYDRRFAVWKAVSDEAMAFAVWGGEHKKLSLQASERLQRRLQFDISMQSYESTSRFLFGTDFTAQIGRVRKSARTYTETWDTTEKD